MPKQPAFPSLRTAMKKKQTRRELFLSEMEVVVLWGRLLALIAPQHPKAGRPPMPLKVMLRVCFRQNWPVQSSPAAEEALYDSEAMRRFAGIELGCDRIPDETAILNFRHLLARHGLSAAIFAAVNGHLADKGNSLRSGTLVDAPSSTKNKARDPEMSSTQKGNDWYFGSEEDPQTIPGDRLPDERPLWRRCGQRRDAQSGHLNGKIARCPRLDRPAAW